MSGIQDDLTSTKDLPLRSQRNETERVKERRINKEETKHLNRMDWIFLHLFKKDPYTLSLFLGTISREPFAEIQPDSAVLLIRALRGRPHACTHTHAHRNTELLCSSTCFLQASLPSICGVLEAKVSQPIMITNPPNATVRINLSSVKHSVQLVLLLLFSYLHTFFFSC